MNKSRVVLSGLACGLMMCIGMAVASAEPSERALFLCPHGEEAVGLTMDHRGNAYTACGDTVYCVPPDGGSTVFTQAAAPVATMAMGRGGILYVAMRNGGIMAVYPDGRTGETRHIQGTPAGMDVDRDGTVLVVTQDGTMTRITP